ncbi:MAG: NAD-dependent epimerase/dehydratase family protein [Chloroflexales bacterium]|nr:NAD-dependent epimerase/dehydratase family protein [Chloroflexales bacterium]
MLTLVTGGNGFVGRSIVEMLLARGDRVRVVGRGDYPELAALGAECVRADLSTPEASVALASAMRGVEVVFHVAAKAGALGGGFDDYYRSNVTATQRVVRAAEKAGVPKFVYTSTPSVAIGEGDIAGADETTPYAERYLHPYPATKSIAERFVLARGDLATVAIRPHLVWGPRDPHFMPRFLDRARAGRLPQIGPGTNLVDVTYVENAAEAHILAADALGERSPVRGRPYFIGQERPVNLWQFINELVTRSGCPPVGPAIPAGVAMAAATAIETAHGALRLPGEPFLNRFLITQLVRSHWFDHSAAQRDFGYGPRISIEEGLRRTVAG